MSVSITNSDKNHRRLKATVPKIGGNRTHYCSVHGSKFYFQHHWTPLHLLLEMQEQP